MGEKKKKRCTIRFVESIDLGEGGRPSDFRTGLSVSGLGLQAVWSIRLIWGAEKRCLLSDWPEDYTHARPDTALPKKRWIKTHSQTQTQGLHRHLTSSLCGSKLTAGPSGKRRGGGRLERQQKGELGNAVVQGEQRHWLKQINLKQTWWMSFTLPFLTSLFGYFTHTLKYPTKQRKPECFCIILFSKMKDFHWFERNETSAIQNKSERDQVKMQ